MHTDDDAKKHFDEMEKEKKQTASGVWQMMP